MKKIFYVLTACLILSGCTKEKNTQEQDERVEQVSTTVLHSREIQREIVLSTNLQGYLTQNVAPSLTGRIPKGIYSRTRTRRCTA